MAGTSVILMMLEFAPRVTLYISWPFSLQFRFELIFGAWVWCFCSSQSLSGFLGALQCSHSCVLRPFRQLPCFRLAADASDFAYEMYTH